jgi:gliding motility-associated-like protein
LLVTAYYRRVVRDSGVPVITDISKEVTILVQPKIQDNDLSAYNEDVCSGNQPNEIFATPPIPTGGTGTYTYYWEESVDNGTTWTLIPTETNNSYLPPPLAVGSITNVQFRRIVSSGIGCPDTSTVARLRYLPPVQNVIVSDQEICSGGQPLELTSGVPVGGGSGSYTYVWMQSDDNVVYSSIPSSNSPVYQPPVLVNATANVVYKYYKREITSSTCTDVSGEVAISILPSISGNTIGADQSICINTIPNTLTGGTLSGGDGSYNYRWFISTDDVTYNEIVGETASNFSPGNLSQPTYYKREVTSKACMDMSSNPVFIDIHPVFDANIADLGAGQDIVCNGSQGKVTITLTSPANSPWDVTVQDDQGNPSQIISVNASPFDADVDVNYTSFSGSTENAPVKYIITAVTDQWGCPAQNISGEGEILALRAPVASAGSDTDVCGMDGTLSAVLEFGTGVWSGPAGVNFADATDPLTAITAAAQGSYLLTWTSSNGVCIDDTDETTLNFWDAPSAANIIPRNDTTLAAFKSEIDLQAELIGPLVGQLEWSSPGDAIFNPPDGQFTRAVGLNWGENKIILKVINGTCPAETDEIKVTVLEDLKIPKGISPRTSIGQNDYFNIENIENIDNELIIFSRSGNVVFKTENFMRAGNFPNGWDGTDRSGNPLPDDTYYYVLNIFGEKPQSFSGYVIIKGNN